MVNLYISTLNWQQWAPKLFPLYAHHFRFSAMQSQLIGFAPGTGKFKETVQLKNHIILVVSNIKACGVICIEMSHLLLCFLESHLHKLRTTWGLVVNLERHHI